MVLYTRQQLMLLFTLLAAAGLGLAVAHWRAAHPELVEQIERFDRVEPDAAPIADAPGIRGATTPRGATRGGAPEHRPRKPPAVSSALPLDLNRASADELTRLPGVGAVLAERIIEARTVARFGELGDLRRVRGVGRGRLERLRGLVTVSP